jgi:hypothetical protein
MKCALCIFLTTLSLNAFADEVIIRCEFEDLIQNVWFDVDGNESSLGVGQTVRNNVYLLNGGMLFTLYENDDWILTIDECAIDEREYRCFSENTDANYTGQSQWVLNRDTREYRYSQKKSYIENSNFRKRMECRYPNFLGHSYVLIGTCGPDMERSEYERLGEDSR